jgi:hypothetical protein
MDFMLKFKENCIHGRKCVHAAVHPECPHVRDFTCVRTPENRKPCTQFVSKWLAFPISLWGLIMLPSQKWNHGHVNTMGPNVVELCEAEHKIQYPCYNFHCAIRAMSWHPPHRPRSARWLSRKRNKVDRCDDHKFSREITQIERINSINLWKSNPIGKTL